MLVAPTQNGTQSTLPIGGWNTSNACYAPCNASFATIDERTECADAPHVPSVNAIATAIATDHTGTRPFWQYLNDSNNRDRLERAAIHGGAAQNCDRRSETTSSNQLRDARKLTTTPEAAINSTRQQARDAYAAPVQTQSSKRLIDLVA